MDFGAIAGDYAPYNILVLTIKGLASQLIRDTSSRGTEALRNFDKTLFSIETILEHKFNIRLPSDNEILNRLLRVKI